MARSTASSEPLTSPTPSPPRSPVLPTAAVPVRAPGFGSDSELSELSDDEEGNQPHNKQEKEVLRNGVSKTRSKTKRVLPGAMWDWAYKKKTSVPDTDPDDAGDDQEQEEGEIEQDEDIKNETIKEEKTKSDPDIFDQHPTTSPENPLQPQAIQIPTVPRQATHEDSGKGEEDMELDPVEEPVKKQPTRSPSLVDDDPRQDDVPALQNDDDDDDQHSASEPDNADVDPDGNRAEDSASVAASDGNDDEEDIASSRPSSPPGSDEDGDDPSHPVMKQSSNSLIAPAPSSVPEPPELDGSPEHSEADDPDPEAEPEQEEDAADGGREETGLDNEEIPVAAAGEQEIDVEESAAHSSRSPTPEPDLLEMPAHRAEALDALALIELKFALLRERLYMEKMEELVEEEGMILNGTHPELIHLQLELSNRRNKRLELALRRREYEEASIRTRKRAEVNSVWEWWTHQRDELQKDMISSHNRKRRKIERQRRAFERAPPHRLIPRPPLPHTLPPPPPLPTILDFESRAPYSIAYGQRPHRPTLSVLSAADVDADLTYINAGKRRFWSHDGPGGSTDGAAGYVNGINGNGDMRDMKYQRGPAVAYDVASIQHLRPVPMPPFANTNEDIGGANSWGKRPDEPGRSERERERDRSSHRQMAPVIHNHSIPPQPVSHSHPHTLHSFPHTHQHTHPTHIHPPPHHHHVHVHHHHHNGPLASPQPSSAPPPPTGSRRFTDPQFPPHGHAPPPPPPPPPGLNGEKVSYGTLDEKASNNSYWRRDEGDVMSAGGGRDRERDRERGERDRDRDRDRRAGIDIIHAPSGPHSSSGSTTGYERVLPSPFPSNSPRRKDSWDEGPRPPIGSPGSRMAPSHTLHPSRNGGGGSIDSPGRRPPGTPPHPGFTAAGSSMSVFPSSPRSVSITPVATGHVQVSKSSNSRPLSPVPVKMVGGGNSGPSYLSMNDNNMRSNLRGEQGFGNMGSGGRSDVYGELGDIGSRRDLHDSRAVAMNLTGIGGGSTADLRERRERLF